MTTRKRIARLATVASLAVGFSPQAWAALVQCTGAGECDAILFPPGGHPSYVQVLSNLPGNFNAGANYIDTANPGALTYSLTNASDPGGFPYPGSHKEAVGSLASGTLKLFNQVGAQNYFFSGDSIGLRAQDVFTLSGGSGVVHITVSMIATGNVALAAVNDWPFQQGGVVSLILCGPGGSFACGGDQFHMTTDGDAVPEDFVGYSGPIYSTNPGGATDHLQRDYSFDQEIGVPFDIFYALDSTVYNGSLADISHTATLSFTLPDGVTISSVGGFGAQPNQDPGEVPEPAPLALLGLGLLARAAGRQPRV
jgi:hypothetical protein